MCCATILKIRQHGTESGAFFWNSVNSPMRAMRACAQFC
jgi:hypothetical protein